MYTTPCPLFHNLDTQGGNLKEDMQLFVRPGLNALSLGSQHWLILGFSALANAMEIAVSGAEGRRKVCVLCVNKVSAFSL